MWVIMYLLSQQVILHKVVYIIAKSRPEKIMHQIFIIIMLIIILKIYWLFSSFSTLLPYFYYISLHIYNQKLPQYFVVA